MPETDGYIDCEETFDRYEEKIGKAYVKPEDYRLCKVIEKTTTKAYTGTESLIGISGT